MRNNHGIAVTLALAGEGPERASLADQIERLGLGGTAQLRGLLEPPALRDLLRGSALYVLPSVGMEAFSISALEAACAGLPLLLSDQVGLKDFLDERDVATYSARSVDALTDALRQLHARRFEANWTDRAARHARLRDKFSGERVAQAILDLIP